jgi:O-antigen/teichoic acid export membrane protein
MRVKNSIINITVGIGNQAIITALSFVSRTVFIHVLGIEYLGINGLFTNILSMLSLAEAGIGSSIVYSLYKPVAEDDQEKMKVLMKFYKNAYLAIALIVLFLGLSIMPFLHYFIKNSSVENIHYIYLLFLVNTVSPYLYVHKNSFLNVCQKGYIVTGTYSISSIVSVCLKIGILYYTKNYILYLVIDSILTITNSIVLSMIVDKMYPFLKRKTTHRLDKETKRSIVKNVKAIVLQNIGGYLVFGTDNLIISSFVSVAAVGLYSNYNMLIDICRTFLNQIFNNVYHSMGNLVAKENKDKIYRIYKVYQFLNFWLYSFFTIFLYIMIEPFITLWIGSKFLLDTGVLGILMITFYERGMRNSITTVKTTAGIFHEDRYAPLCQAVINLFFSIVLVRHMGIAGVFLGTMISAFAVPFWTTPYFVYKKVFHKSIFSYLLDYTFYVIVGAGVSALTHFICSFISPNDLFRLVLRGMLCLVIPNVCYLIIFHRREEFQYLYQVIKNIRSGLSGRIRLNKMIND